MGSPAVHHSESLADALTMLDSHVPLTYRERKLIVESLYDLAFREGARQGRQAGTESVYAEIRSKAAEYSPSNEVDNYIITVLETLLPPSQRGEYADPTAVIRENLADRARTRSQYMTANDSL